MTLTRPPLVQRAADCTCKDPDLHLLTALVAAGIPQPDASRALWGPPPADPAGVRGWVRAQFVKRFPWLRLDDTPDEDGAPCCPADCGSGPCTFPGYADTH